MSFKAKIAAGTATFALVGGGLGLAGTLSASAATPPCGSKCSDLYTLKFHHNFILDTYHGTAAAGQEVILFQASNSDPAEDFVIKDLGSVGSFYNHNRNLISPAFDHSYHSLEAYEFQYEPYGRNSGFCASTWSGAVAQPGYKVRLEPCGQYSNSIWAGYTGSFDNDTTSFNYYVYINGGTNSFSDPLVLNYPEGNPTDMPRPWINVQPLQDYSNGDVFDNQQWKDVPGPA